MRTYTILNTTTQEVVVYLFSHLELGEEKPKGMYPTKGYTPSKWENLTVGEIAPFTYNTNIRRDT